MTHKSRILREGASCFVLYTLQIVCDGKPEKLRVLQNCEISTNKVGTHGLCVR